ncbi:hypothetical protein BGX28_007744 [Mortierella sp. GBA30]|nr:hypothetical protein BGX28_007744 [Mortierella sp. GBA30]
MVMVLRAHPTQDRLTKPSLPAEILKLVAHHLQDNRRALHACLLVSRAWSQAAVEYLYKAEHMMSDYEFKSFSTLSPPALSLEGLSLEDETHSSSTSRPKHLVGPAIAVSKDSVGPSSIASRSARHNFEDLRSEVVSQLLLKRTLDRSLLHDATCSYDYISYLNKISCPWFADLIQDRGAFCGDWRGHVSRQDSLELRQHRSGEAEPSMAREEHCFNRLVRKVSKRCLSVDEFRSCAMLQSDTLIYAIRHFKNLTWMDLKDSQDLNDQVFEALARTVRSLSYIRLPGSKMESVSIQAVTDMILAQDKDSLCQFKIMHGTHIFEDDSILKAIGQRHGRSMKRLTLAICDLENSGLQEHGLHCTHLVSLNLEYSSGVTNDVLHPILDSCRHLAKLDLTETDCTHLTIQGLSTASDSSEPSPSRFASMKRLILNNIDAPFTTSVFLPLADACPNLEELHMNSILADSFQDFSLFIAKTPKLMDLDIGNVFPEFTDANLISLVDALPGLRWLSIANTQITNASLAYLAQKAQNLFDLCILGCDQVTKTGLIDFLDKMANKAGFRHLDITYCRLEESAVAEIREKAKQMALELGTDEIVEVDGDDQFADSLVEEEGEGEREENGIGEDVENVNENDHAGGVDNEVLGDVAMMNSDELHVEAESVSIDVGNDEREQDDENGGRGRSGMEILESEDEVLSDFSDVDDD